MSDTWNQIDAEQKREAPPYPCSICHSTDWWWRQNNWAPRGDWLCGRCHPEPKKEADMPTDKGHCPHGEFILTEGCPQCITERQLEEKRVKRAQEVEQLILEPAPEEACIAQVEDEDTSYRAPYNASYHAPYRLQNGSIVPGVTTVLKELSMGEGLNHWCWDLGRQGLDYREVRDAAGRVGTITHHMIACHLKGENPYISQYSRAEVDKAAICFDKYLVWEMENPLTPVMIEERLVSELFKFGGTLDLLAEMDGEFVLIDFKTGSAVYDSYLCQLAAYQKLLEEQDWRVAGARIIRLSPDDSEVEVAMALDHDRYWQIFQHALGIYKLRGGER